MRLALIRLRYSPYGGAERFTARIARRLATEGVSVHVVAREWPESAAGDAGAVRVHPVTGGGRTRAGRLRAFRRGAAEIVRREGFDLVQSHERMTGIDVYRAGDGVHAGYLARLGRERSAWSRFVRRFDPFHRDVLETERAMARDPRLTFVANSAFVAREIRDLLGVPDGRVVVIENGVDLSIFGRAAIAPLREAARARLGIAREAPLVLCTGSGFERKGVDVLIRALAAPALKDAVAVVVGTDRRPAASRRLAESLGVAARVRFEGGVDDVRPYLAAADAFALPSLYDPMPNAALEALAAGLPVVATRDTGIADLLESEGAGIVAPRDPDAVAAALADALRRRAEISPRAEASVRRLDEAATTARWLDFYRERLAAKGR